MLFGNPLRLRGEFFTNEEPADPGFQDKLREHIRRVKPILPVHYAEDEFVLKDLYIYMYLYIWSQYECHLAHSTKNYKYTKSLRMSQIKYSQ